MKLRAYYYNGYRFNRPDLFNVSLTGNTDNLTVKKYFRKQTKLLTEEDKKKLATDAANAWLKETLLNQTDNWHPLAFSL